MDRILPWVVSIFTGLMLVALLNFSPLGNAGFGIELPWGWSGTSGQYDCTGTVINGCGDCQPGRSGIPLASSRRLASSCFYESNNLGLLLNALVGVAIGMLGMAYIFTLDKHEVKDHAP